MREIIIPSFRDRIVHHCIDAVLRPILEDIYIHDVYAGRVGRWVHFGLQRAEYFLRSCSGNFAKPVWSLRLDIRAFFRSISHEILWEIVFHRHSCVGRNPGQGNSLLTSLIQKHLSRDYSLVRRDLSQWHDFPLSKSIFTTSRGYWLPLWDLFSQHLANLYLTPLDHYIKHVLEIKYYGRYMDDMVFFDTSRERLQSITAEIRAFLETRLYLTLHPDKIDLRSSKDGCDFLGRRILPHRTYLWPRIKRWFIESALFADITHERFMSHFGLLGHHSTHNLMKKWGVFHDNL
jgi:RNA-directed DNA polymerase